MSFRVMGGFWSVGWFLECWVSFRVMGGFRSVG